MNRASEHHVANIFNYRHMKKLILSLFVIALLFGCEEQDKIDVLPNYDVEYYKVSDYERYSMNLVPEETQKKMQKEVYELFKTVKSNDEIDNPYKYDLFIDHGKITKIRSEKEWDLKFDNILVEKMNEWTFGKYVKDGVSQKYKIQFSFGAFHYKFKEKEGVNIVVYGNQAEEIDKGLYYLAVEEMPSPIGGMKAIQKNITYPEIAKSAGIQGRVFVKAYIDSAGIVKVTEIIKGIGSGCDEVAMNAVKMTLFNPGVNRGKFVGVQVTVPILFKLDDTQMTNKKSNSKIIGTWEGKADDEEIIKISFFNNGTTDLYKSKSGRLDGEVTAATFWPKFKIDYAKKPYSLNLIYDSEHTAKLIVKFNSLNEIIVGFPKDFNSRPKDFNKENMSRTWKLKRVN